ncbi:MAG: baaA1 [Candidatus Taylorbacteria bacterium]|nr:baaA1 [Candidatus Taylorbacteria bacterium]
MKKAIFASALASLLIAGSAFAAAGYTFTNYLKVGSTGADVTALQSWLVANNFLTMPAGVSMGYFGQLTKAAVVKYQASVSLPATGFVGPLTVAKLNGGTTVTTTTSTACPAGYTCTALPGTTTTTTTTTTTGGITTPGAEGTLTVSQGAVPNTTVYVGQSKVTVLNLALQAQTSDINVARVTVDLGTDSSIYTKKFATIYAIADNGTVLASMPLNTNTVTKSGVRYSVTLTGLQYLVKKNMPNRYLYIAADLYPSVDSTYRTSTTFALAANGIRGVDGAGIDEITNNALVDIAQQILINASLSDSADIKISTDPSNPLSGAVIASSGPNNDQADKVTSLVFAVKAEKDSIGITSLTATTTIGGAANNSTTTSAYLYAGSELIASAAINVNGAASFTNINGNTGYVIPQDTTKVFSIKVDIRGANSVPATLSTTITNAGVSAQNSQGTSLTSGTTITGSATTPNTLSVLKAGPVFTLVGTPTISKSVIGQTASSTFASSYTFNIAANGTDVVIPATGAMYIGVYVNGTRVATSSASYEKPVSGVTGSGPYTIADGSSATFKASISFVGPNGVYTPAGGIVTTRLESVTANSATSTYMSDVFRATGDAQGNTVTL